MLSTKSVEGYSLFFIVASLFLQDFDPVRLPENDVQGLYNSAKQLSQNVCLLPPIKRTKYVL
jgi:hypothetical protein